MSGSMSEISDRTKAEEVYPTIMDVKQIASYIGIKVSTVYAWTHRKFIPYMKVGGRLRFAKKAIDTWLKRKSVEPHTIYD